MRRQALIVAVLFAATAGLASGEHSASPCPSNVTAIGADEAILYLIEEPDGDVWIYEEANDHPWLQRGGVGWYEVGTPGLGDPCWDIELATGYEIENPDFIVL